MRSWRWMWAAVALACQPAEDDVPEAGFDASKQGDWDAIFTDPDDWSTTGPGLGRVRFDESELWKGCAFLQGDPELTDDHHNLVVMYDGYLIMPWAPEYGGGGVSVFDVSDPCDPQKIGEGYSPLMRESHSLGFAVVDGRTYMAVDYLAERDEDGRYPHGGVGFWDMSDLTAPVWAGEVAIEGHAYPDSYTRLTLSVFWQGDLVFGSTAFLGAAIIDASDPTQAEVIGTAATTGHLVGSFHVWGTRAMASNAGLARTVMWDLSTPRDPQPIPGGDFDVTTDEDPGAVAYYFANMGADYALFARKDHQGGPILYDVSDPSAPTFVGHLAQPDGDGGYIFEQNGFLFQGESHYGAVYDIADPTSPVEVGRIQLQGDLDTVTPLGNLVAAAVDDKPNPGEATMIAPWTTEPDRQPPRIGMRSPEEGETGLPVTARVGMIFDEMLEPMSAHPGSARLVSEAGEPVEVMIQVQENILNLSPLAPLAPDTTYHVQIPEGGVADVSGNRIAQTVQWSFRTAP